MSDWFDAARLGIFVHWSHCSARGRELSWPMVGGNRALPRCQDLRVDDYYASVREFCPRSDSPRRWLEKAARAGVRYAVLTAKHHDGFAMYRTRLSDFSIAATAFAGDPLREYVEAARDLGLRVGVYFSLCDWHHPDYPAFRDEDRPYFAYMGRRSSAQRWQRYLEFLFGQVREVLSDYGRIDLIWFDGGWERSAEEWRAAELAEMIRALQPGILINDRLPGQGDYDTPEQFVPAQAPARRWETCLTMNDSWGYNPDDSDYKSARALIHTLCEVAGRGGNLLLNVGPRGDGSLPPEQESILDDLANWMARHAGAVIDTRAGLAAWQFYGPTTRRGDRLFLYLLMRPYDRVSVRGVPVKHVRAVRLFAGGQELSFSTRRSAVETMLDVDAAGELIIRVPESGLDRFATVLEVEMDDAAAGALG